MTASNQQPVAVIGAGLAGLTAANFLRCQGVPVILYEAGRQLAGLAQSFHDDDGFTYDFGAHFITNRLAEAIGVRDQCRDVSYYGETVRLRGRDFGYPFGLLRSPKFLASGIAAGVKSLGRSAPANSAAAWYRQKYGRALADEVAIPLTEAWSGTAAEHLAPSVADSIPGSMARTLFLKAASRVTGRAVACGYSREKPEKPSVWHVYPKGGVGVLCRKLAENLHDAIRLESPVEEILVEQGRAVAVRVKGQVQAVAAVVSTAPCHVLPKLVTGTDALQYLRRFRYRPMVFVNLRLQGCEVLPDTVLWTPEADFPFFRLTETTQSMPWLAPPGKTLVTADIGCETGDAIWQMDEAQLGAMCLEGLRRIIPDAPERYLGCRVLRTPIAYPVYHREYEADRQRFAAGTGVAGLYSIGRNGEFTHLFMEDVYWRTLQKMAELVAQSPLPAPMPPPPAWALSPAH